VITGLLRCDPAGLLQTPECTGVITGHHVTAGQVDAVVTAPSPGTFNGFETSPPPLDLMLLPVDHIPQLEET
jgi:hypothetical protein